MDKETKRRIKITMFSAFALLALVVGVSFAAFSGTLTGTKTNTMNTGCLKITMEDEGSLSIQNAAPATNEEGLSSDPYIFSITNVCTVDAYYETTINVMDTSNVANAGKVKLSLDGDSYVAPIIETALPTTQLLDENIVGVSSTYKLDEGYLKVGQTKNFELRTWIDYDVTSITGSLENKIIINSTAQNNRVISYKTNSAGYYALKNSGATVMKNANFDKTVTEEESGILHVSTTNGDRYFFRGIKSALNNNIQINGENWFILSTNEDGSINIVQANIENDVVSDTSGDTLVSAMQNYYDIITENITDYIKTTQTFCIDNAKTRVESHAPSATCSSQQTFTKVGLLTADDLMYAGYVYGENYQANINSAPYLFHYYGLSGNPIITSSSASTSSIYTSSGGTTINVENETLDQIFSDNGVSPIVITLKADTKLSGKGTTAEPFYISGSYADKSADTSDTRKPVITYARVDDRWKNSNKSVEIAAKDDVAISGYMISTTNTTPNVNDSAWEATASKKYNTVNKFDNGTYYAFAKDAAGNISDPVEVTIQKVDKVAPTCTVRINTDPDETYYKTLTIMSDDTNIDLNGYSWDDDSTKEDVREASYNALYTAHLHDLAGNEGTCSALVTTIMVEGTTVLYGDGTLIINEKPTDREANLANHTETITRWVGYRNITETIGVYKEYEPLTANEPYIFIDASKQLWANERELIKSVEIGQKSRAYSTAHWFEGAVNLATGDFSNLNTSNVTNMYATFSKAGSSASAFSLTGLEDWDTSNVVNMEDLFNSTGLNASSWSISDISEWDTSNVENMRALFYQAGKSASAISLDLSDWDVSSVVDGHSLFSTIGNAAGTWSIGDLSGWRFTNLEIASYMLASAGSNATTWSIGDISNWGMGNVEYLDNMFLFAAQKATSFNVGNIGKWDTSNATTMERMFYYTGADAATTFNVGTLANWNTESVTTMDSMFTQAGRYANLNLDLSGWDVSNVVSFGGMFRDAACYGTGTFSVGDLSSWEPTSAINFNAMFRYAGAHATTWNSIGTIKVRIAANTSEMFREVPKAKATVNIYATPTSYTNMFLDAATDSGALITVNRGNGISPQMITALVNTKSASSNVVYGGLVTS